MDVKIEASWKTALEEEFGKSYFAELTRFVKDEYKSGTVYPPPKAIFRAFELTPFNNVEVVILGQDPYHGAGQANGLSFAVNEGVRLPPSLQNIFKELEADLGSTLPISEVGLHLSSKNQQGLPLLEKSGDLTRWEQQGVLLLNATLTVRGGTPGSHQGKGWEMFTDAAIKTLSEQREHLVFILWGNYARQKGAHIDRSKHCVIESPHPSPFSAYSGFFGSKPFTKTNAYLKSVGKKPINW